MTATDTETTVLRDASETAARQRDLLAVSVGRSNPIALLRRLPLVARAATTESAARSGLRYQPVAWTVIAVVAIAWWFPGRDDDGERGGALAAPPFATTATQPTATTAPPSVSPMPSVPAAVPSVALPRPAVTPTATRGVSRPVTSPPTTVAPPTATSALAVRGFGWAARLSGTGVSAAEVPADSMPVANRLGQLDKASFLRLTGTDDVLRLTEVDEGARQALGPGVVVACPITDAAWQEGPDQSFDDAPPWDATACVAGSATDGTWTFDLSGFDADADTGFALVPDASAPADFQVTFASTG